MFQKLQNEELNRITNQEYQESKKVPVVLVLDNVRSQNNVGSAFRTGDAFRIEKIYLCGITSTPNHREVHKTALGAEDVVAWEHNPNTLEVINKLKAEGYKILSVEQAEDSTSLETVKINLDEKFALIFGNEVKGVSQDVVSASDACLEIPQLGTKHSFNISVTIGIVLWQLMSPHIKNFN